MSSITSLPSTFSSFDDLWSPRLVASTNDHDIKIAKIDGKFIWHSHPNSDELFYLLDGQLTLEMEAGSEPLPPGQEVEEFRFESGRSLRFYKVVMKVGDMFVVPQGVRHRPVASNARIMMIEKQGTVNTGDVESNRKVDPVDVRKA